MIIDTPAGKCCNFYDSQFPFVCSFDLRMFSALLSHLCLDLGASVGVKVQVGNFFAVR